MRKELHVTLMAALALTGTLAIGGTQDEWSGLSPEARGKHHLLYQSFAQGGNVFAMSPQEFNNLYRVWPEPLKQKAEAASPSVRRKMTREYYGLFNLPGKTDADLESPPLGWVSVKKVLKKEVWEASCLMCHAGAVKKVESGALVDEVVIGLSNNRLDLTSLFDDRFELTEKYPKLGARLLRKAEFKLTWNKYKSLLGSTSRGTMNLQQGVALNLYLRTKHLWTNPFTALPTLAGKIPDVGPAADVEAPPWWNTRQKTHLYASGLIPNTPKALTTSYLARGNRPLKWHKKYNEDLMSYINSVQAPKFIFPVDKAKAAQGKVLFEQTCAKCHGTYEDPDRPNYKMRYISNQVIGTDPNASNPWSRRFRQEYLESWLGDYGKADVKVDPEGYIAPPLTGIWASAPYLHNGSVPALKHLLMIEQTESGEWVDVGERPMGWKADFDSYDVEGVGLAIETKKPESFADTHEQRMWFDASNSVNGKRNTGHTGPTFFKSKIEQRLLTAEERALILEYLKTL